MTVTLITLSPGTTRFINPRRQQKKLLYSMVGANTTRQKVKARKAFNREMGKAAWVKSGYVCA